MKINRCKLDKNTQRKLVEFFVAEVTARTAANLLDIQPNTAALFYRKIREIITV
ncbi:IS1595 family transposase, partial [Acinetobacter baumannii]